MEQFILKPRFTEQTPLALAIFRIPIVPAAPTTPSPTSFTVLSDQKIGLDVLKLSLGFQVGGARF